MNAAAILRLLKHAEAINGGGKVYGEGSTVPSDAATGWAAGAIFQHTDGSGSNDVLYVNIGDETSANFDAIPIAGSVSASNAEIDRVADVSARIVNTTGDLTLTEAAHEGRIVTVDDAAGAAITLPAATGGGARYKVVITTTVSSNSTTIKVANASDSFIGSARGVDDDVEGATGYQWNAEANDDTVTMDGSATGGKAGDYFTFVDVASNKWLVEGSITQSGASEATPFSATVS